MEKERIVKWFSEIKKEDSDIVGEKAVSIAELYRQKFLMPPGFVLTADLYREVMQHEGVGGKISRILEDLNIGDKKALKDASDAIIKSIQQTSFPKDAEESIIESYDLLDVNQETIKSASGGALSILKNSREPVFVALRTSLPKNIKKLVNSKQEYFLNIKGHRNIMDSIKKIYASFFTEEEIFSRLSNKIENRDFNPSIIVQKMVNADKSGIIYSCNRTASSDNIMIKALWGLGLGRKIGVNSDKYILSREDIKTISQDIANKEYAVTRNSAGETCSVKLTPERASQQTLTNHEIKILGQYAMKIESTIGKPQRIDFCISNSEINILGTKEMNVKSKKAETLVEPSESPAMPMPESTTSKKVPVQDKQYKEGDIEQLILKELEVNEYQPAGIREKDQDMPRLNDAIFVEEQRDLDEESKPDLV